MVMAVLFGVMIAGFSFEPAQAASCGGNGQKACHPLKRGPVCKPGLGKFGKICRPCGKANQKACPKLTPGKPCAKGLAKIKGYCRRCGGNGQRACPVAMRGPICKPGLGKFGKTCRPCGRLGQRACPAIEKLRRKLNGTCVPDKIELVRRAALEKFAVFGQELLNIVPSTVARSRDNSVTSGIRGQDSSTANRLDGDRHLLCRSNKFQAYTWGVAGDAKAILGMGGDAGFAYDIRPGVREYRNGQNGRNRWKFYASGGFSLQAGAGASAGVTFGCWLNQNHSLSGKTHGVVFDLVQLAKIAVQGKKAFANSLSTESLKQTGFSILVGFWFDPDTGVVGDYQGFTVTPVAGRDVDVLGVTYVKGATAQFRPGR
jgi:hypothetical protein